MTKQKPGVYDRVLKCAKAEFLSKGYLDDSLLSIAQGAGASTGFIYTWSGDKERLLHAIAKPVVDEFTVHWAGDRIYLCIRKVKPSGPMKPEGLTIPPIKEYRLSCFLKFILPRFSSSI